MGRMKRKSSLGKKKDVVNNLSERDSGKDTDSEDEPLVNKRSRKSNNSFKNNETGKSDQSESESESVETYHKKKRSKSSTRSQEDEESDQSDNSPKKKGKLHKFKGKYLSQKLAEKNGMNSKGNENLDEEYEVEKIVDDKLVGRVVYYKIRWKGYGPKGDTWEPENTLSCPQAVENYKKAKKNSKKIMPEKWDENKDYEVDRIKDVHFFRDGKREFLVSWKGYGKKYDSWEPEENMDCKSLIEKFMEKCDKAREATQKELRVNRKATDRFTLSPQANARRLSRRNMDKQRVQYHEAD